MMSGVSVSPIEGLDVQLTIASLQGTTHDEKLQAALTSASVVLFTKEHCLFCLEVEKLFEAWGVPVVKFQLDACAEGAKVHSALKAKTGQATVPYVFIGGELLGGCVDTKAAKADGSLLKKLAAQGIHATASASPGTALAEGNPKAMSTLFHYPEVVDDNALRFTGVWVFCISVMAAIFFREPQIPWIMGFLLVDFSMRFLGGVNITPLGGLSAVCCALADRYGSRPRWVEGQSKQFATLCGATLSGLALLFFMLSSHNSNLAYIGLAFTSCVALASFLQGFVSFCLGCFIFGLLVDFGFFPEEVFMVYTTAHSEAEHTWKERNKQMNEGAPTSHRLLIHPDGVTQTSIDYMYKAKTDDMTREDFNIIKHVKITHFMAHMGLAGLATAWHSAFLANSIISLDTVQHVIVLGTAALFVIWLCLYALKCYRYPSKVHKEWMHNVSGNAFVAPFATLVLFAESTAEHSRTFAHVLFWIGAPICLVLSFVRVGDWIARRKNLEHLNASWMLLPVSNAVVAFVGPFIEVKYTDACQFWFAVAFMMWLLLFAATFYKAIIHIEEDERIRCMMATWLAAPAVLAVAYLGVFPMEIGGALRSSRNDFIFVNLHWFAVSITLILLWCFIRPFFGRMQFDMAYWAAGFPTAALALSCLAYNRVKPGGLSQGIAYAALTVTSATNCVLFLQTVAELIRGRVFVPDYKWGPLSFMQLNHEAFRGALHKLTVLSEVACSTFIVKGEVLESLQHGWQLLGLADAEHAKHENQAIFKLFDDFYPGITKIFTDEHQAHKATLQKVEECIQELSRTPYPAAAQALSAALASYSEEVLDHLRGEEDHLRCVTNKHINITLQKEVVRKCWELTPATTWQQLLPWIINSLPMLHQRVRFIKTLLWAMPERAQHIGMMVGLGVDPVQWKRITDELPEIIPRAAPGWTRYY